MSKPEDTGVFFFIANLKVGGAERVMIELANEFARKGYPTTFVMCEATGSFLPDLSPDVKIVDLKQPNTWFALPAFLRAVNKYRPKAVISALELNNLISIIARPFSGVHYKTIISLHNALSLQARTKLRLAILRVVLHFFYPLADTIVAVSKGLEDDAVEYLRIKRRRFAVIYNPVIIHKLERMAAEPNDLTLYGNPEKPVVLGVSRLGILKNFPLLIEAFELVRAKRNCQLVIVGEGDQRPKLERQIAASPYKDDILLYGISDNPYSHMKRADVFVLSSDMEGLPSVLIEAMATGVPVISTDCPHGPREILDDGKYGFLIPMREPQIMADTILDVLAGKRIPIPPEWLKQFTPEESAAKYEALVNG